MQKPDFFSSMSQLIPEPTAHGCGVKFVFRTNKQMLNASTQVAFGCFEAGVACEEHVHLTMDEYFFFISGTGTYRIDGVEYKITPEIFFEIPAGKKHSLHADNAEELRFIYWGVAINYFN